MMVDTTAKRDLGRILLVIGVATAQKILKALLGHCTKVDGSLPPCSTHTRSTKCLPILGLGLLVLKSLKNVKRKIAISLVFS